MSAAAPARMVDDEAPLEKRKDSSERTSVLRVGLLSDRTRVSYCMLRNISAGGLQIRTFVPISAGVNVHFRVGDSEREECEVAWTKNGLAGLKFVRRVDPKLLLRTTDQTTVARRSSPRISAAALMTVRTGGRTFAAELCDISPTGVKIRTRKPLSSGSPVVLTIPDLPPLRGFVCWSNAELSGISFERPLAIPVIAKWVSERRRVGLDL